MKVVGNFNKISPEMEAMLPKIGKNEVKTFQLVTGVQNTDPDMEWRRKNPVHYATWQIPTRDRILDWATNKFVDIGLPDLFQGTEVLTTKTLMPGMGEPHFKNTGLFSLSGNRLADVEVYEYLSMCNFNESNRHRDESVYPIFKEINVAKDSAAEVDTFDELRTALNVVDAMSEAEMRQFAAAELWSNYDLIVLKAKIAKFAQQHPAEFNRKASDPSTKEKAEIKEAIDKDVLEFDIAENTMKMGHTVLATLSVREDSNFLQAFYEHCQTAPNGKDILASIRKQLKGAKVKKELTT